MFCSRLTALGFRSGILLALFGTVAAEDGTDRFDPATQASARRGARGRSCSAVVILVVLMALSMVEPVEATDMDPAAIEALLNETAEQLSEPLREEGKGYSYYTYGTSDLLYAVGDLDGDGSPEIAARVVYFPGMGSYDLVDIFADRGDGYQRVDFLNLYNLGLEDEVESLEIREGRLRIRTVGIERGSEVRRCGAFHWRGPKDVGLESSSVNRRARR